MNFRPHDRDEPELNLIPLIDVLIILLIFLVMTTTFANSKGLEIRLPETGASATLAPETPLTIAIDQEGRYLIENQPIRGNSTQDLIQALKIAAGAKQDPLILIAADRNSRHQALIATLEALGELGFQRISFATSPTVSH